MIFDIKFKKLVRFSFFDLQYSISEVRPIFVLRFSIFNFKKSPRTSSIVQVIFYFDPLRSMGIF